MKAVATLIDRWILTTLLALTVFGSSVLGQDIQDIEQAAFKQAMKKVAPSVVRLEPIGGLERVGQLLVGSGPTTGVVASEDGYVISSAFNFIQQPTSILVTLPSGKRAAAKIVARDKARMLVLLKVNTEEKLPVPEFVSRDEMRVGQWSIAVGRTLSKDRPNMSVGVISALNRVWGKAIQTDAKISPSNYGGPLINIRGQVLGILVPLSPRGSNALAGAEWYDSGIGFAIPYAEVYEKLETLKNGKDLMPGLIGISLKGTDIYADPVVVAAVQPKSPAAKAGIKVGDKIVEIEGKPIIRQAQLRHALGRRYAGDKLTIVVERDKQKLTVNVELVDRLLPYEHPFLGVLPERDVPEKTKGVLVRTALPGSPAEKAGIRAKDVLMSIDGKALENATAARDMIANLEPNQTIQLQLRRGSSLQMVSVALGRLPTDVPAELPPAATAEFPKPETPPPTGEIEVDIPEDENDCLAYIPDDYHPSVAHGLVIWLHTPGEFDKDALLDEWRAYCKDRNLILLAPQAKDPKRWVPTELGFIRKAADNILGRYNIDRSRVVTHGNQGGATMAYLFGFQHRDLVRAIVPIGAAMPRRGIPANDPVQRLAFYHFISAETGRVKATMTASVKEQQRRKFPAVVREIVSDIPDVTEMDELVRWIDTLDRM